MDYIVEPKSRKDLRELAYVFREKFGLLDELYFPIVELLDILVDILPKFSYEIVEDDVFPAGVHADTDVSTGHIRIKESVYERAVNGEGRDRMTIAHEIGHFFTLCFCGFKLLRNFSPEVEIPAYCSPEWQAKCFAGELMIPSHLVRKMSASDIERKCGVSYKAAVVQLSHIK